MRIRALCLLVVLLAACAPAATTSWSDDFSSPGSWLAESDTAAQVGVQNGALRIFVAVPNQLAWTVAGRDLGDFHLTVEATQVGGPDDNEYGVLARVQDSRNFYRFSISGDGYFMISKFVDGGAEPLSGGWMPSPAIRLGQATNVVEVVADGATLTLIVNGEQLAQVDDGQFAHGDIGLYAGSFYEGGVEVSFDNLRVEPVTAQ